MLRQPFCVNLDDSVQMGRHDDESVQTCAPKMRRNSEPRLSGNLAKRSQLDVTVYYRAENTMPKIRTYRYKLQPWTCIISRLQTSRHGSFRAKSVAGTACCATTKKNAYFKRAPTSTSSVKAARTGLPSGPTLAATIIPLDSTPRSLRGARFTTTTTLRPTSDSGS